MGEKYQMVITFNQLEKIPKALADHLTELGISIFYENNLTLKIGQLNGNDVAPPNSKIICFCNSNDERKILKLIKILSSPEIKGYKVNFTCT